ncbi:MAG: calcium-binding protein, partial [Pseudomonadota bacterium]
EIFEIGFGADTIGDSAGVDTIVLDQNVANPDWLTFETRTVGTSTNLTAGTFTDSFGFQNTIINVENVYGGAGADLIIGDGLANTIIGGNGADTIQGLAGADSIAGGLGGDLLIIGAGDIVSGLDSDDLLRADGGDGSALIASAVAGGTNLAIGGLTFLVEGLSLTADDFQQVGADWQLRPTVLNPSLALPPSFPNGTVINQNISDGNSVMTITSSDGTGNLEIRTIQPVSVALNDVPVDTAGLMQLDLSTGLGAVTYGSQTALAGTAAIDLLAGLGLLDQLSPAELALISAGLKPDPIFDPPTNFRYVDVAGVPGANTLPTIELSVAPGPEDTNQTGIIDLRDVANIQATLSGFDQVVVLGGGTILDDIGSTFIRGDASGQVVRLSAGNDTLVGGGGVELAYGNQGNDLLYGNQGADRMFGGKDVDTMFGGQGSDALYGNLGADAVYGNKGVDALYGGQGDDQLFGGQEGDLLFGGKGADRLVGGAGNDTMFGGPGADQFDLRFGQPGDVDVIFDYVQAAGDTILLRTTQPILSTTVSPTGDLGIQIGDRAVLVVGVVSLDDISFSIL